MRNILVLGAGRSSSSLISYLLNHAQAGDWHVTVGDFAAQAAAEKVQNHARGRSIRFDINDVEASAAAIAEADVVVSLLPAHLHPLVASHCLALGKHLLNASYVSAEMKGFHAEAVSKGLLFLNECGLDPGIDHMSAMQVIDRIRETGGRLTSFESFTGGLIAPETDPDNPWRYKFTWNPRNVVMAGQSTAKYLQEGKYKYIPYQQLFKRITPVQVPGHGNYEGYANRDSLKYIDTYGLADIRTMLRGTLRNSGFCASWNLFVQLGCCDDTYEMEGVDKMTHRSFIDSFLEDRGSVPVDQKLCERFGLAADAAEIRNLRWSGLFSDAPVGLSKGTPAQVLEHILNKKWKLDPADKDQIVMWHRFVYEHQGKRKQIQSSLVATGTDSVHTAMAQTVGLPLAIAARLLMQKKIAAKGVVIPTTREFYEPVLAELQQLGIVFSEE
ncbi:saccharopine dehydrogenase NADP-binding domain-containing protein [Fulvivirgaceae bacterium PWU4]|uniref:Saccharopine dehydrogenase NADP-binding domain-containing protein n=1 Tax=Chryseosolibacter histidini TaxID=2782349 RepID=A0AAP2GHR0_9BACT|nr:saccharopine dehydrogenase C-terminal domain-containing protein [Chryseosolibacter histidini]MBT1696324.1 saccharopine dehydrogenase NADP-binding domain-containing protein [Chryseosolibacter histidini]